MSLFTKPENHGVPVLVTLTKDNLKHIKGVVFKPGKYWLVFTSDYSFTLLTPKQLDETYDHE